MKASILCSFLLCILSFYSLSLKPKPSMGPQSKMILEQHLDIAEVLEHVQTLSLKHHLNFISFTPLFERGSGHFLLHLDANFSDFIAWYLDVLEKMPKLKWQHLHLKPKDKGLMVTLEGIYAT